MASLKHLNWQWRQGSCHLSPKRRQNPPSNRRAPRVDGEISSVIVNLRKVIRPAWATVFAPYICRRHLTKKTKIPSPKRLLHHTLALMTGMKQGTLRRILLDYDNAGVYRGETPWTRVDAGPHPF